MSMYKIDKFNFITIKDTITAAENLQEAGLQEECDGIIKKFAEEILKG